MLDVSLIKKEEQLAKSKLGSSYKIKNIGETKLILGMCINRSKSTGNIILSQ